MGRRAGSRSSELPHGPNWRSLYETRHGSLSTLTLILGLGAGFGCDDHRRSKRLIRGARAWAPSWKYSFAHALK